MAVEYGTVAIIPDGEWNVTTQYDVGNLVSYDGSSYVARIRPPVGTLPTDLNYWQVSAQGANKATTEAVGVVKPDGTTITIDADGTIHGASTVDTATVEKAGIVKASNDIPVAADGTMSVSTQFAQAAELANIIAGEAISQVLGKVSKSIAVTMGLDQNALLKNMLTNIDANDQNKIPTAAFIHTLYERIGMGTELTAGSNLTEAVNQQNSDIRKLSGTTSDSYTVPTTFPYPAGWTQANTICIATKYYNGWYGHTGDTGNFGGHTGAGNTLYALSVDFTANSIDVYTFASGDMKGIPFDILIMRTDTLT